MSTMPTDKAIVAIVENGQIVLPSGTNLPNGTLVRVSLLSEEKPKTLRDLLKKYEGVADDLPSDMAENHNHYIHGHPKK